jgi:hypothetical protein
MYEGENMNLQDLSILLAAIELAVKRGTFSILEVGVVGDAASKLNAFLADAKKQQDEAAAAAEAQAQAEQPTDGTAPAEVTDVPPADGTAPVAE